ncbi:MAG: ParA family protein [Proteobacteria bacterium]|nr:ParA family protein [Pseudomonadota bacterium]
MAGVICAISNHKGGVGKTSLALNLSTALAIKKKKVLVIDNDPQGDATKVLIPGNIRITKSIYELLNPGEENKPDIIDCIYPTIHTKLYLLPNVEETAGLDLDIIEKYPECLLFLRNQVRKYVIENYDFIFIDCSPTLSIFVANALYTADCCIVPMDAGSANSLDGLRKVLDLINSIQNNGNPDLKFLKLLINRVDRRTVISKTVMEDAEDRFGRNRIFRTVIPVNTTFQQSEFAQKTIFDFDQNSRGAAAYRKLAMEFLSLFKL